MKGVVELKNVMLVEVKQTEYSFDNEDKTEKIEGISNKITIDGGMADSKLKVQERIMDKMLAEDLQYGTMLNLTVRLKNIKNSENLGLGEVVKFEVVDEKKAK